MSSPSSQARILVIEDERDIRELIALHLSREGFAVQQAQDGASGWELMESGEHDLYVIDWMLPQVDGIELIRRLRERGRERDPILMVTARAEAPDIVAGLEAGADDYITKPFEIPVLLARARALLRRSRALQQPTGTSVEELRLHDLRIDLASHAVFCRSEQVMLTRSEFKLLVALAENQGRVLTRQKLIDLVQGQGISVVNRAIDTHVFGLRKKLGECGDIVETVRGVGYRIKVP